jgi:anti-anti-sigma factor
VTTLSLHSFGDARVIAPAGRLDHENCDAFQAELTPQVEAGARAGQAIVLDLSRMEYVSSAGLRCFMLAARDAREHRGRILVAAMQPVVAEIFQISRFNLVFETYPTLPEALASVSPGAAAAYAQG